MAASNPGAHRADGRKCSGNALLFAKTAPQTVENKKWLYVNSWGRGKNTMIRNRVGASSSGTVFSVRRCRKEFDF